MGRYHSLQLYNANQMYRLLPFEDCHGATFCVMDESKLCIGWTLCKTQSIGLTFVTHDIDQRSTQQFDQRRKSRSILTDNRAPLICRKYWDPRLVPNCCTSCNHCYKYRTRLYLSKSTITLKRKGHRVPCSLFSSKRIPKRISIACDGSNVSDPTQSPFINMNLAFEHQTECLQTRPLIKKSFWINLKGFRSWVTTKNKKRVSYFTWCCSFDVFKYQLELGDWSWRMEKIVQQWYIVRLSSSSLRVRRTILILKETTNRITTKM